MRFVLDRSIPPIPKCLFAARCGMGAIHRMNILGFP